MCDTDNHRIQIISDGPNFKSFGIPRTSKGDSGYPKDIVLNKTKDCLFITDQPNNRVLVFYTTGEYIGVFLEVSDPFGIWNYIAHRVNGYWEGIIKSNNVVYMYGTGGGHVSTLTHDSYKFDQPCGVVVMNNGQIVVASVDGNRLTVI